MDLILSETVEGVTTITLNRPEKRNALSSELLAEFDDVISKVSLNGETKAIVLAGEGKAFSSGADISSGGEPTVGDLWKYYEDTNRRQLGLWNLPVPTVAAVQGFCLGRGLELALWADIIVASEDAKFGQPEIRDGSVIATIVPWLTSPHRAKLFMFSGDLISADEALEMGLISRVVSQGDALKEAQVLARKLAHVPSPALKAVKQYIRSSYELRGLLTGQEGGSSMSVMMRMMAPNELGTEELERIRERDGLKAYVAERDKSFLEE